MPTAPCPLQRGNVLNNLHCPLPTTVRQCTEWAATTNCQRQRGGEQQETLLPTTVGKYTDGAANVHCPQQGVNTARPPPVNTAEPQKSAVTESQGPTWDLQPPTHGKAAGTQQTEHPVRFRGKDAFYRVQDIPAIAYWQQHLQHTTPHHTTPHHTTPHHTTPHHTTPHHTTPHQVHCPLPPGSAEKNSRRSTARCPQAVGQCIAGVPLPTAPRRCDSVLQELHCLLPPGSAVVYRRSSTAPCPQAVG